jgi:hypothetical protein
MKTQTPLFNLRSLHMKRLATFGLLILCVAAAHGQWSYGGYVGPGIQTLSYREPTITDAYKPRTLPQAGLTVKRYFGHGISLRGGLAYDVLGTKSQEFPHLDHPYKVYWSKVRIDYVKAFAGVGLGGDLSPTLGLEGFADFAYGLPVFAKFKDVEDGKVASKNTASARLFNHYLGLNLGLSLKKQVSTYVSLRFSPTFQTQVNTLLGEGAPNFHFTGFVPRVEAEFFLPSKRHLGTVRRGNRKLYIDNI